MHIRNILVLMHQKLSMNIGLRISFVLCLSITCAAGTHQSMPFAVTIIWRKQEDHTTDCYFSLTHLDGFTMKTKLQIQYANVKSVSKPVSHAEAVSPPSLLTEDYVDDANVTTISSKNSVFFTHEFEQEFGKPHLIIQVN